MKQQNLLLPSMMRNFKDLKALIENLKQKKNFQERLEVLNNAPQVREFLLQKDQIKNLILTFKESEQYLLFALLAIGQGEFIFKNINEKEAVNTLKKLLEKLEPVEKFYDSMGGIMGYHAMMLQQILEKTCLEINEDVVGIKENYLRPPGIDITQETSIIRNAIKIMIEKMPLLAEIYVVGGAGDRLQLKDEETGGDLPAAELLYEGRSLLEGLIRDLQAREYLYYKLFNKQISIPIAMMTSDEKGNHEHILAICERHQWFGRPRDSFQFFKQPLVPVLTEEGNWAFEASRILYFKPGGHGVLWKLAMDAGVFDHLLEKGCSKILVRQINNPVAGTDYGLMAFVGLGILNDKLFGFSSCPRLLNTAEGMDVLIEKKTQDSYEYCISNVEYPDFEKKHIQDIAEKPGSSFSAFPANTNILFADIHAIKKAIQECPLPGMLINMKLKLVCLSSDGQKEFLTGRLESLMQNIADVMTQSFSQRQHALRPEQLKTYLTYNNRRKTISVTKKLHKDNQPIVETPEGCYYDQLFNHYELFTKHCGFELPEIPHESDFLKKGPSFVIQYHPALGPIYSIIAQKIQKGRLKYGAELVLEISELELYNVDVEGSLLVEAENVMGHRNEKELLCYSGNVGRCILKNVKIMNKGMDREKIKHYWKKHEHRHEALKIRLKGHSEFIAENVNFSGTYEVEVPNGCRMIAKEINGKIQLSTEPLLHSQEHNPYVFGQDNRILIDHTKH